MEALFKKLPLTIQQSTKYEIKEKKSQPIFAVKKYNTQHNRRFSFYKPISKIVSEND